MARIPTGRLVSSIELSCNGIHVPLSLCLNNVTMETGLWCPAPLSGLLYLNSFLEFLTKPFTEAQLIQDSVRGLGFCGLVRFGFCFPLPHRLQKVLSSTNAAWQVLFVSSLQFLAQIIMAVFIARLHNFYPPTPPNDIVFNENSTHSTATFSFCF